MLPCSPSCLFLFSVKGKNNLRLCDSSCLIEIQYKKPRFGGLLNGVFYSFSSHPGVLHAAIGHVVDPERGIIVNNDAADVEIVESVPNPPDVARKHPGLEPVVRGVDPPD